MSSAGNVNGFIGITKSTFEALFSGLLLTDTQKKSAISIFNILSNNDGILSFDDWKELENKIDIDDDENLTNEELEGAIEKINDNVFNMSKSVIINLYRTVEDYIKGIMSAEEEREVYYAAKPNPYRAKDSTHPGTFDYKWLEKDCCGSTTYTEWLENLNNDGYEYDEETGNKLLSAATSSRHSGYCAESVRNGMNKVKVSWYTKVQDSEQNIKDGEKIYKENKLIHGIKPQGHAYKYASEFVNNPYFKEIPHNIVATMDLNSLPIGCIFIYDAQYKVSPKAKDPNKINHPSGHLGVKATPPEAKEGKDEGGGRQSLALKKQATHIRVFMPVKPTWV